ncbi:hypothetical protein BZG36_05129 [Bifiguratus adelaidae]|uniref:histone deacetylase n=1 Tax=Bifiguratus adelaidae TaxID=1938954 RepID=A0A261XUE0_9FUNG|nr:hypothetical protein BZG36_05129 [Bifiguratus adelaidae]
MAVSDEDGVDVETHVSISVQDFDAPDDLLQRKVHAQQSIGHGEAPPIDMGSFNNHDSMRRDSISPKRKRPLEERSASAPLKRHADGEQDTPSPRSRSVEAQRSSDTTKRTAEAHLDATNRTEYLAEDSDQRYPEYDDRSDSQTSATVQSKPRKVFVTPRPQSHMSSSSTGNVTSNGYPSLHTESRSNALEEDGSESPATCFVYDVRMTYHAPLPDEKESATIEANETSILATLTEAPAHHETHSHSHHHHHHHHHQQQHHTELEPNHEQDLNQTQVANDESPSSSPDLDFVPEDDLSDDGSSVSSASSAASVASSHSSDSDANHPESPFRTFCIWKAMKDAGVLDRCQRIESREVTDDEVHSVHTEEHWRTVQRIPTLDPNQLFKLGRSYNSIYLNPYSYYCSRLSCGSTIDLCSAIATKRFRNGFAIVRPPGHHAESDEAMGFCILNNVAVAVSHITKKRLGGVQKVLILDWDVHHGNGTQRIFISDPNVLYISLHRYENAQFYPQQREGGADYVGKDAGVGKTVNIPWPRGGMGDGDYIHAFQRVVMPIAYEFDPDLVVISAGFDAAAGDPLGGCFVTPAGYAHMTHMLMALAGGKVAIVLEGGYNLHAISTSALACMRVLLGDPLPRFPHPLLPSRSASETVLDVMKIQSRYWACFGGRRAYLA